MTEYEWDVEFYQNFSVAEFLIDVYLMKSDVIHLGNYDYGSVGYLNFNTVSRKIQSHLKHNNSMFRLLLINYC